ncbi:hypothetical protein PUN28_016965 [Cardiocondyla obscurior]|uniref:LAGLIDADG homing endonuclease n=1 Tax=Cardiocondyla obscurior TaxID=286306 RepID=A0AAW2ENF9_9HYME
MYNIPLGNGVFCSKTAYSKLINVEDSHADWAYALLKGVFGEKAHRMRVRISKKYSENEKFPQNFLMVAKFLHCEWLTKQTMRDNNGELHSKYTPAEVEKYINTLPAYLADRAYDMQGGRPGANVKNTPRRRSSESTEPKRNYKKRGQLLSLQRSQPISPSLSLQYQEVDNNLSHLLTPSISEIIECQDVEYVPLNFI